MDSFQIEEKNFLHFVVQRVGQSRHDLAEIFPLILNLLHPARSTHETGLVELDRTRESSIRDLVLDFNFCFETFGAPESMLNFYNDLWLVFFIEEVLVDGKATAVIDAAARLVSAAD